MTESKFGWLESIPFADVKTFVRNHWKTISGIAGVALGGGMWAWSGGSPPHISEFVATPSEISKVEEGTTLRWQVENAKDVRLNGVLMGETSEIQAFPEISTTYVLIASNSGGTNKGVVEVSLKDAAPPHLTISSGQVRDEGEPILIDIPEKFEEGPTKSEMPIDPNKTTVHAEADKGKSSNNIQTIIDRMSQIRWRQEGKTHSQVQAALNECIFAFRQSQGIRSIDGCMESRNYRKP